MIREILISIYLTFVSLFFNLFSFFPLKKKIVFCISFIENNAFIYNEIKNNPDQYNCVMLSTNIHSYNYFKKNNHSSDSIIFFTPKKPISFIVSLFHLATSKVVVIDNYFGFLAVTEFKKDVKCLQIWHSVGAIKTFGYKDASLQKRSEKAIHRFTSVYKKFEFILVGSKKMEQIYKEAFGLSDSNMLKLGVPRTDLFFKRDYQNKIIETLYDNYPNFKNKKIIMYAPTFRDGNIDNFHFPLNIQLLENKLGKDYIFIIKLHPAIKRLEQTENCEGFLWNLTHYPKINDLLFITDILISDYSSIPFEFSFLGKPMIFFPYDLNEYKKDRGFWEPYEQLVPGPIVYSTQQLIKTIKHTEFDFKKLGEFHNDWNEYSKGNVSKKISKLIIKWYEE